MDRSGADDEFEVFVIEAEPRLRRSLCATYGAELGREATAEALAYAWEHWRRLQQMTNPIGYLFRVGQSRVRRLRRRLRSVEPIRTGRIPDVEPRLISALDQLTERQRTVAVLVCGFGWSHVEVGEVLEIAPSSVASHLERALARLRSTLGVETDV